MREELIRAALVFLRDPKLASSTLKDKLDFLKAKGLTQTELDEALNLALVNRSKPNGTWNIILMIGICFGTYKLYRAYMDSRTEDDHRLAPLERPTRSDEILRKVSELASEVKLLKTLLLGHERFAAPPKIPEWQLDGDDRQGSSVASPAR